MNSESASNEAIPVQDLLQVDEVCNEFEDACKLGTSLPIQDYLDRVPASTRNRLLRELIALDFHYRIARQETVPLADYLNRFPELDRAWLVSLAGNNLKFEFASEQSTLDAVPGTAAQSDTQTELASMSRFGDYILLEEIARGGMGVVYKARQKSLNRMVAVKFIRSGVLASTKELERFQIEAEAAASLDHPNIVPVYEVGERHGHHYLVMKLIEGPTLAKRLNELTLSPSHGLANDTSVISALSGMEAKSRRLQIAQLLATVARAVHFAHQHGILHRDLKPSNILLDGDSRPYVTDFGLARRLEEGGSLTESGALLGTPCYMAPEAITGQVKKVTTAVDVYALGVILYEMLAGKPPFFAPTPVEILYKIVHEQPPSLGKSQPLVARDLEVICMKCLRREPQERYASAEEFAEDLDRFVAGKAISARPMGNTERIWKWARRNPGRAAMLGLVGMLALTLIVGGTISSEVYRRQRDDLSSREKDVRSERDRAVNAEIESREKLYQALMAEARGTRVSRKIGQRWGTLDAIIRAKKVLEQLDLSAAERERRLLDLRNEAIAALALPDLRALPLFMTLPDGCEEHQCFWEISLDGKYAAVSSAKGLISIRRIAEEPSESIEVDRIEMNSVGNVLSWSEDGRYLMLSLGINDANPEKRMFGVWAFEDERLTKRFMINVESSINQFGTSPDGTVVLAVSQESIRTFELPSGRLLRKSPVQAKSEYLPRTPFHPTKPLAFIREGNQVSLFDWKQGVVVGRTGPGISPVRSMTIHPDGELLYVSTRHYVSAWSLIDNRERFRMVHDDDGVNLSLNPTGDVLVGSGWASRTMYWDAYTGRELFRHNGRGNVRVIAGDRLTTLLPSEFGSPLQLKEFSPGRERHISKFRFALRNERTVRTRRFGLHPEGRLLAVGTDSGTSFIDIATGSERLFHAGWTVYSKFFPPDGAFVSNSTGGWWKWPVAIADKNRVQLGPPSKWEYPRITQSNRDGSILASSDLTFTTIWHRGNGNRTVQTGPHTNSWYWAVSPDGRYLATGSHESAGIRVWNTETGALVKELLMDVAWTYPQFSPDGLWLTDWTGHRWRVGEWTPGPSLRQIPGMAKTGPHAFSPDGSMVAVDAGEGVIILLDAAGEKEIGRLTDIDQHRLDEMEFTPDGLKLITISTYGETMHVWDLRLIREGLRELDLDWGSPPYPPEKLVDRLSPLIVEVDYGDFGTVADRQLAEDILNRRPRSALDALTPADRAVKKGPTFAKNWLVRGQVNVRLRKWDDAVRDFEEYLKLSGAKPEQYDEVAWHTVREPGQSIEAYRKAREWAEKAVAVEPLNVSYRTTLAAAQYRSDDYEGALANVQLAAIGSLLYQKNAIHAGYLLAMVQYRLSAPNDSSARARARKTFDETELQYRQQSAKPVDLTDLRFESADVVDKPRLRYELTVHDKTALLKADPKDTMARFQRADAHLQLGRHAESEADCDVLIAVGTTLPGPNHYRGHARERQLKFASALADYEAALKLTAESLRKERAHLHNEIARIQVLSDDKLQDADAVVKRCEQAVALDPALEVYAVTLGIAHFRNGSDRTALRVLELTDDRKMATPQVVPLKYLFLAKAQHRLGRAAEASASYEKAVTDWNRLRIKGPEWTEYFKRSRNETEKLLGVIPAQK